MLKDVPHVEAAMDVSPYTDDATVKVNGREMKVPIVNLSKPGIEFFCGKLLYGSSKEWTSGAPNVIVSRSTAEKMFGTANAVGKTFMLGDNEITVVGFARNAIGASDTYMGWGRGRDDKQMSLQVIPCDYNYLRTMGLKIAEGRDFRESDISRSRCSRRSTAARRLPYAR